MCRRQIKFEVLFSSLILAFALESVSRAQNKRQVARPTGAHQQKAKDRHSIPDFQRDPIRVVKEFHRDKNAARHVFDLALTVENSLGSGGWEKLDEKQRAAVTEAFESVVKEVLDEWTPEDAAQLRILKSEIEGNRATVIVLRELELINLSLTARDGAWFIIEHEVVDDALPEMADAIQGALAQGVGRGKVYEMPGEAGLRYVDNLIAKQGESPQLLLLKYRVLVSQQVEEEQARAIETLKSGTQVSDPPPRYRPQSFFQNDRALELLVQITRRWPDFVQGHLALAFDLLYYGNDDAVLSSTSKDAERAIAPLQRYIELVPYDPRPWRDLANAYLLLEKNSEAERAFRSAIERDPTYLDHRAVLVSFLLSSDEPEKAKADFGGMLKIAPNDDEAFDGLYDEGGFDPDYARSLENLLLSFPQELAASKSGLVLLANAQELQNKSSEAVKTMQRAVAVKAEAEDYEYLSQLYRQQQRYTEALNAANQALKLDDRYATAHFERACSFARLGRRRDALAALKQMMASDPEEFFDPDEPDLQPLANLPEFRALKEKMKEAFSAAGEKKTEDVKDEKARKPRSGKP